MLSRTSHRLRTILSICGLILPFAAAVSAAAGAAPNRVERVEAKKVCMINDALFVKDQIPVVVDGRTHYGCCEMCKERLAKNPAARSAVDPVSGKKVDKALAVIGAGPDGSIVYFENEKNLAEYTARRAAAAQ